MNIQIKDVLEYMFFMGPFLLIGISLFGIFLWLALRSQKFIKILFLLIIFIATMFFAYGVGRTAEKNNNQLRYIRSMEVVFSHFSFLLNEKEYFELSMKMDKLRDDFAYSLADKDRLLVLVKYLTTPLDENGLKDMSAMNEKSEQQ